MKKAQSLPRKTDVILGRMPATQQQLCEAAEVRQNTMSVWLDLLHDHQMCFISHYAPASRNGGKRPAVYSAGIGKNAPRLTEAQERAIELAELEYIESGKTVKIPTVPQNPFAQLFK